MGQELTIPRNNPVNAYAMGGIVKAAGMTIDEFRRLYRFGQKTSNRTGPATVPGRQVSTLSLLRKNVPPLLYGQSVSSIVRLQIT
jgi:hypothetical protein